MGRRENRSLFVAPEWIERHCVIPDGFRQGAPFLLYDYQLHYFAGFYLVRGDAEHDPTNPTTAAAFVHRRGILVGPQKLGKGPHTAAHICLEGVGPALFAGWAGDDDGYVCSDWGCSCGWEYPYEPGEPMGMPWPTPLIQVTAVSEDQTENIYDALRPMIEQGPLSSVVPKTGEQFIRLPGGGRIDTVTSSAMSRLGQRITFAAQDEVGLWTKLNKMQKVADTQYRNLSGMGGRASLTTNMWDPTEKSVAQTEYESTDSDVFRYCVRPPAELRYERPADRRKIHRIVYPPECLRENGGHVDLRTIEAEAESLAKKDPAQAARFYGNIHAVSGGAAIDAELWAKHADGEVPPDGSRIALGFDGSISNDATVLVGVCDGVVFTLGMWERPMVGDKPDPTWRVPRTEVADAVHDAFKRYDVGRMFADPPKWATELEAWADQYRRPYAPTDEQERVLAFDTNQHAKFARAVDRFITDLSAGAVKHCGEDRLTAHVTAAMRQKVRTTADEHDQRTLYVFKKPDDGRKIDGAIATVLAYEAAATMPTGANYEPVLIIT